MAHYRKWLKSGLAGSMSVLVIACSGSPTAPGSAAIDTPAVTPIAPIADLPSDEPAAEEPAAEEPAAEEPAAEEPAAATGSDASPTPEPTPSASDAGTTAEPTPTPTPTATPTPTPTATPTPLATATPNPFGNDSLDGFGDAKLTGPTGITIANGTIYVADNFTAKLTPNGSKVRVFDNTGTWMQDIYKSTLSPLQYNATGVAIAKFKVFVSNANSFGGLEFKNPNGTFSQFGIGTKDNVATLTADDAGSLYVANTSDGCVSKFSDTGETQGYYFVNGVNAVGLAFDSSHNLHVADVITKKIKVVSPAGAAVREFATGINSLGCIAVDRRTNEVYAVDIGNHQIKRFKADGTEIQTFGTSVLSAPRGIAIDDSGVVHVVDRTARKVFRFTPGK
jgi:hypothetical protein